jgi:hypothetical protein
MGVRVCGASKARAGALAVDVCGSPELSGMGLRRRPYQDSFRKNLEPH